MSNKSAPCSCVVCKETKPAKGIFTHYIVSHTSEGKTKNLEKLKKAGPLGNKKFKELNLIKTAIKQQNYYSNPKTCLRCQKILPYEKRQNDFCSKSCSATLNNQLRCKQINPKTKKKFKPGPQKGFKPNRLISIPSYSKVSFCVICNAVIRFKHNKTCSDSCKRKHISNKIIERIKISRKTNYQRGKPSYLERSFVEWLQTNQITLNYITEYTIKNHLTGKWYFVDFYFPDIKLVVELDGRQHEKPKHQQADKIRDQYIKEHKSLEVFRISYDEYQQGIKINSLLKLLVPRQGNAPSSTS